MVIDINKIFIVFLVGFLNIGISFVVIILLMVREKENDVKKIYR